MKSHHLSVSSQGRHPLFPGEALKRQAVRKIVEVAGPWLSLFCVVDDHAHVIVFCDRHRASVLARALQRSLRALSPVGTQPMYVGEVTDRDHMVSVRRYVLDQPAHHDLPVHSALWSGNCFLDLVGARAIPGLQLRIQDSLPRFRLDEALRDVKLPTYSLEPANDDRIRTIGLGELVEAAAVSCVAPPALRGIDLPSIRGRRAACVLARRVGIPQREVAWALGIDPQSARRLARSTPDEAAITAIRRYVALKERVALAQLRQANKARS
jgi:hypothetical protein